MKLPKNFFEKSTIEVAKDLLGCVLIHETKEGKTSGIIVETEAYLHDDPASHSFVGKTQRNSAMFGEAGTAYIYIIYGIYQCFNVVTNKKEIGEAVLIRALEPLEGIEIMKSRRKTENIQNLCSGPAKLVEALKISKKQNGDSILDGNFRIELPKKKQSFEIIAAKRIGITKAANFPHRFYIRNSKFVSAKSDDKAI